MSLTQLCLSAGPRQSRLPAGAAAADALQRLLFCVRCRRAFLSPLPPHSAPALPGERETAGQRRRAGKRKEGHVAVAAARAAPFFRRAAPVFCALRATTRHRGQCVYATCIRGKHLRQRLRWRRSRGLMASHDRSQQTSGSQAARPAPSTALFPPPSGPVAGRACCRGLTAARQQQQQAACASRGPLRTGERQCGAAHCHLRSDSICPQHEKRSGQPAWPSLGASARAGPPLALTAPGPGTRPCGAATGVACPAPWVAAGAAAAGDGGEEVGEVAEGKSCGKRKGGDVAAHRPPVLVVFFC